MTKMMTGIGAYQRIGHGPSLLVPDVVLAGNVELNVNGRKLRVKMLCHIIIFCLAVNCNMASNITFMSALK